MSDPAPTIVLLHGAGDTPRSWDMVRDTLPGTMTALTPARVTALSDRHDHPTLARYLSAIDAAVAGRGEPLILVGHSFGGLLARAWAASRPERVRGLVLVDPTPPQAGRRRSVAVGLGASAVAGELMRRLSATGVPSLLLRAGLHPLYPEHRSAVQRMSAPQLEAWRDAALRPDRRAVAELRHVATIAREAGDHVSRTHAPAVVIASAAYGRTWVRWQQETAQALGAAFWTTGDRYHNIHLAHPDVVARAIGAVADSAGSG